MKPKIERIETTDAHSSFTYYYSHRHGFFFNMHYHGECELTFIGNGGGKRFVGDSIESYADADLVLIGPDIPHTWYAERDADLDREVVCIQFKKHFAGEDFLSLPENKSVKLLLEESKRGLSFKPSDTKEARRLMIMMDGQAPQERLFTLFKILALLSSCKSKMPLCSRSYVPVIGEGSGKRIDKVFEYLHENFKTETIHQKEAARLISLSESAFSHFFKKVTGVTFVSYLNDLRISYSCKLLLETDDTIVRIAYQSGFNNLSNFNRRFLKLKKCSPRVFRSHAKMEE